MTRESLFSLIWLIYVIIIIFAGLWPFDFAPENRVEWINSGSGIHFYGRGMAYTAGPFGRFVHSSSDNEQISIEIRLRPDSQSTMDTGRILSLCDDHGIEVVLLSQWRSLFMIETKTDKTVNRSTFKKIGLDNLMLGSSPRLLTITSSGEGTAIYADGKRIKNFSRYHILPEGHSYDNLVVGNSPTGGLSWKGIIKSLAFYKRALPEDEVYSNYLARTVNNSRPALIQQGLVALYLFNEGNGSVVLNNAGSGSNLLIPETYHPLEKTILTPPWKDFRMSRSYFSDIIVNVLGFIPFGLFSALYVTVLNNWKKSKIILMVTIAGLALSLAIELTQVFLPSRHSQLMDVISNTMGTVIGAAAASFFAVYMRRQPALRI